MVVGFVFIDFQLVFQENTNWCVPKFDLALETALFAWNKIKNQCTFSVATSYVPPNITGIWKEYFDKFPDIPTDPSNKIYNLADNLDKQYITKARYSGFSKWNVLKECYTTCNLINQDKNLPKETYDILYLCGVATDCCVLSTALDAVDSGIKVYLISDACASGNDKNHERALNIMKGYSPNIEIINSQQLFL